LSALQLPENSEVIIPACNFPTVVNAALVNGYRPVLVDVDPLTYCLDLDKAERAITKKTKAIVVVDIAGNTVDLENLHRIAKKHKLVTILDNCDGFGSEFRDRFVETYVDIASTSFHAAHIITTGEGGAVFTNNNTFADRVVSMREWGRAMDSDKPIKYPGLPDDYPSRYTYITRGFNLKPIELQAAMGRVQLKKLRRIKQARSKNFNLLISNLSPFSNFLSLPYVEKNADISWFSFPITLKGGLSRKDFLRFLEGKNIETRVIFAGNILKQPAYKNAGLRAASDLSNSNRILRSSFFISVHPSVTGEMMDYVIRCFKEYLNNVR
jgi:CDP-6-deoxy-D-xylo-4-hexulose-3-dehydrase